MSVPRKNIRKADRAAFTGDVKLTWEEAGYPRLARATGCDLSDTGMSCRVLSPIPERTQVRIEGAGFASPRYAVVRHCTQKGARFLLGLEFRQ